MIVKCTGQIAVFILLLFALFMDVKAQTPNFDCPSDFDVFNWTPETTVFTIKHDNNSTGSASISTHWLQGAGNNLTVLID
ncbi:MAG: hypothetical protein JNL36_00390 [Candidatus Kapabacteria bacterium]|nr:hypothetical protein [Candidatus Kapabacteria bacterium]